MCALHDNTTPLELPQYPRQILRNRSLDLGILIVRLALVLTMLPCATVRALCLAGIARTVRSGGIVLSLSVPLALLMLLLLWVSRIRVMALPLW